MLRLIALIPIRRSVIAAIVFGLAAVSVSIADLLKPPAMTAVEEKGSAVIKAKSGGIRSKSQWTMRQSQDNGKDAIKMTESGQGVYSGFNQEVRWNVEAWWSAGDAFRPLRFEKIVTDVSGRMLLREHKQFDWNRNEVRFEREEFDPARKTTKVLAIPTDTLAVEGIAGALRSLPFAPALRFPAHFLTNEPKLYTITLEVRGREAVSTATGAIDCYKVELVPHLGALDALRFLFPKAYFWLTVEPPHSWVRYQGPENGPGSPEIIME